ncbi:RNA polymerase sigma factor [Antarcticibacterium sp. 1MA-6-2]|uniref:RNA polymerase sigma factor n=1 Tax=Antarcticibacterium sp. 1MA-6-2 TaxID=2908210 RepID=UPI001F1C2806|nr:RNA polymerase sigma factor [Antarcticibacterium sp. 1MA-6-2]UJH92619.1 RNA polymerase sigma factor [Antarcticibacterium sp. 1MA-6-2]
MGLKKLIIRCKKQDRKAQEELYHAYAGKFLTLCLKYSESYEQAEDNLQDGFIKIFSKIDQYNEKGTFEGWMTRIMINTAISKSKKQFFTVAIGEKDIEDPEIEIKEDLIPTDYLTQIIQELPDAYRHVFNLYALDGYTHKEIASLLNISVGTSKSNFARARMKLKQKLQAYQDRKSAKVI